MADLCAFRISLVAANAIGVLRPDFLETLAPVEDGRFACTVDDQSCRVECSREVALGIAGALQAHVRSAITPLATGAACGEAAAVILSVVRRMDESARRDGQSNGGKTTA